MIINLFTSVLFIIIVVKKKRKNKKTAQSLSRLMVRIIKLVRRSAYTRSAVGFSRDASSARLRATNERTSFVSFRQTSYEIGYVLGILNVSRMYSIVQCSQPPRVCSVLPSWRSLFASFDT